MELELEVIVTWVLGNEFQEQYALSAGKLARHFSRLRIVCVCVKFSHIFTSIK